MENTSKKNASKQRTYKKSIHNQPTSKTYHGKFQNTKQHCLFSFKLSKKPVKWYLDLRLWSPLYILLLVVVFIIGKNTTTKVIEPEPVVVMETVVETTVPETTVPETTFPIEDSDIIALARLADSVGRGRSDEVKRIIMWIAINRVEDRANGYGGTLKEELARPNQWQGYDANSPYLAETAVIADEVYTTWKTNGARPIYPDMLWLVLNTDGTITVRNRFKIDTKTSQLSFE